MSEGWSQPRCHFFRRRLYSKLPCRTSMSQPLLLGAQLTKVQNTHEKWSKCHGERAINQKVTTVTSSFESSLFAGRLRLSFSKKKLGPWVYHGFEIFHFLYFEPIFGGQNEPGEGGSSGVFFGSIDYLSNHAHSFLGQSKNFRNFFVLKKSFFSIFGIF